jgi:hypothetical protein
MVMRGAEVQTGSRATAATCEECGRWIIGEASEEEEVPHCDVAGMRHQGRRRHTAMAPTTLTSPPPAARSRSESSTATYSEGTQVHPMGCDSQWPVEARRHARSFWFTHPALRASSRWLAARGGPSSRAFLPSSCSVCTRSHPTYTCRHISARCETSLVLGDGIKGVR